jgi:hypothetical protein
MELRTLPCSSTKSSLTISPSSSEPPPASVSREVSSPEIQPRSLSGNLHRRGLEGRRQLPTFALRETQSMLKRGKERRSRHVPVPRCSWVVRGRISLPPARPPFPSPLLSDAKSERAPELGPLVRAQTSAGWQDRGRLALHRKRSEGQPATI